MRGKMFKTILFDFIEIKSIVIFFWFALEFFRMCEEDQSYFPSDVRKFDWDAYCYNYNLGLMRYIANDLLDDFEPARRRMRKFYIAHFFVLVIYYSLLALFYFYLGRLFGINQLISSQFEYIVDLFQQ